jgi:hypothetical protein
MRYVLFLAERYHPEIDLVLTHRVLSRRLTAVDGILDQVHSSFLSFYWLKTLSDLIDLNFE